jgi:hypothetical protein
MEASSLAQQYMLPGMVQHVADRLSADLTQGNLGTALSYALKVCVCVRVCACVCARARARVCVWVCVCGLIGYVSVCSAVVQQTWRARPLLMLLHT